MKELNSPDDLQPEDDEASGHAEYRPNHIPANERVQNAVFSALLFSYGTYGVWMNDLHIPGKRSQGIHLHDAPAWIMYGAMICACLVMISVIVDHYDRRNNEINYRLFFNIFKYAGWSFFSLAISVSLFDYDGSFEQLKKIVLAFGCFSFLIFGAVYLADKKDQKEKKMVEQWRELESAEINSLSIKSNHNQFSMLGEDFETMQRNEYENRSSENVLYGFQVKRILRNKEGQYFYWVWNDDSPHFFKHITQVNAKIILKDKYVQP